MTAQEYREWEREHVKSQPQVTEARAEQTYQRYCAFAKNTGIKKPLSRQRYELALNLAGLYLHRVERTPDGGFIFVFLDPEHECENLLKEFNERSGVSDALALLQEFDFVRRQMKKIFKVEREEQD